MSYRELRNMTNLLRKLGYVRLVSFESFRTPNFRLVEDILRWFVTQLEPGDEFLYETQTEDQRVIFIRAFVELMLKKVNLKLNPKRLYQADGYAVRELLKVTEFINTVMNEARNPKPATEGKDLTRFYQLQPSLTIVKKTQEQASSLTKKGVNLFDLLTKEIHLRANRTAALTRHYDLKEFEQTIQSAIGAGRTEQAKLEASIEMSASNITVISTKIEKKRQELERSEQRLQTMNKVRPAYMDEFDKIQKELEVAYLAYVTRFKILCHLQHQMDEISRNDESRRAEEKLIKQDLQDNSEDILLGRGVRRLSGSEDDEDSLEDSVQQNARDFLISRAGAMSKLQRPTGTARNEMSLGGGRPLALDDEDFNPENELVTDGLPGPNTGRRTAGRSKQPQARHVGSMFGLEDEEDEDEETDSGSDMILLDGQQQENHSDLGSDIDEEELLMMRPSGMSKVSIPSYLKEHIIREELKHNPTEALSLLNEQSTMSVLNKPPPPGPNVSNAASADDLRGQLLQQQQMDEGLRQSKPKRTSSKTIVNMSNGDLKQQSSRSSHGSFESAGDSLTRPLEPEPRYTSGAMASGSHQNNNGVGSSGSMGVMGNGRGPLPPKSSGARKKYSTKGRPKPSQDEPLAERPRTRPGSQTQKMTSQLISDDDDF